MKRILFTLLAAVLVIGVLAGAGYAGYQFGFRQGAHTASNGDALQPPFVRGKNFDPAERPALPLDRGFERRFDRGFPHGGFRIMNRGGFGFFSPFMFLGHIALWGLILLLAYLLFTRSGWRLTRTEQTVQKTSPNVETVRTVQEEETKNE